LEWEGEIETQTQDPVNFHNSDKKGFFVNRRSTNVRNEYKVYIRESVANSDVNKLLYYFFIN
jgi:hypothetical protein